MTTFATLKRRHWEVNLEKHERAVAVGDVHGDLRALLGVLHYAGVVAFPPSLDVGACHSGDSRRGRPLRRNQVESIQWTVRRRGHSSRCTAASRTRP